MSKEPVMDDRSDVVLVQRRYILCNSLDVVSRVCRPQHDDGPSHPPVHHLLVGLILFGDSVVLCSLFSENCGFSVGMILCPSAHYDDDDY
jgi:hypothetical protein